MQYIGDSATAIIERYKGKEYRKTATETDKQAYERIVERLNKLKELKRDMLSDSKGKYDKKGVIELQIYSEILKGQTIQIEVTQRELVNAGFIPEELKWKEKTRDKVAMQNMSAQIAEADREIGLTTTEVGGFKGFIKNLLDKFKGKGEK